MEHKSDPALGKKINEHLLKLGVETPMKNHEPEYHFTNTDKNKVDAIRFHFTQIWKHVGMDLEDDSLKETPLRMAKMYANELFWGLNYDNFPRCMEVENKFQYDEMVLEKGISVMSVCEHHGATIKGVAHVAYIPQKKVIGLSKLNRIVSFFSHRPQVQERLTAQIFHTLSYVLDTPHVGIVIDAEHFCVKSRGVEDHASSTITSKLGGSFKDDKATRAEFMHLVKGN